MSITLKPISIYQELEPYDVDVDNRPLLDIQDNLSTIADILNSSGNYMEIAADPSQEPAGFFTPFTCACIYSNNLLIPIDISKPITELDYSAFPIVLVLNYNPDTKLYACLAFSAGIALTNKFTSFVPGSEGRLLRVGPGGEIVDQLYYDLAHASKGYQALYVGKILTTSSIVFGGNQVNVIGNNYYLGKNRNDATSGLITVQRSLSDSNIVFKSITINDTNAILPFAEFVNASSDSNFISETGIPVYFSNSQLSTDQSTGAFLDPSLESRLNEVHFQTPALTSLSGSNQAYLTAGVNLRSLLDFNATNLIHTDAFSNTVSELSQTMSTKLIFSMRDKSLTGYIDTPIGVLIPAVSRSIGNNINGITNQPDAIIPSSDTTGFTLGDYFGVGGAFIGGINDVSSLATTRPTPTDDQATQTATGVITSNIITQYSDGFTLLISTQSTSNVPSNLALSSDGYLSLSSVNGILTNAKTPVLDLELTSKKYVDTQVAQVAASDSGKVPLSGTIVDSNITGSLFIDVSGNTSSNTKAIVLNGVNFTEISSYQPVQLTDASSTNPSGFAYIYADTAPGLVIPSTTPDKYQLVTKEFLGLYVSSISSGAWVSSGSSESDAGTQQTVYGTKTFVSSDPTAFIAQSTASSNITIATEDSGGHVGTSVGFTVAGPGTDNGTLTINNGIKPVLLERSSNVDPTTGDPGNSIVTLDGVNTLLSNIEAGWNKNKSEVANVSAGSLKNVDTNGWIIIGNLVYYWCKTTNKSYPDNTTKDAGDSANPEYDIGLPTVSISSGTGPLFNTIFSIQSQLIISDINKNAADVWTQIVGFDPGNTSNFRIKYQCAAGINAQGALFGTTTIVIGLVNPAYLSS